MALTEARLLLQHLTETLTFFGKVLKAKDIEKDVRGENDTDT